MLLSGEPASTKGRVSTEANRKSPPLTRQPLGTFRLKARSRESVQGTNATDISSLPPALPRRVKLPKIRAKISSDGRNLSFGAAAA